MPLSYQFGRERDRGELSIRENSERSCQEQHWPSQQPHDEWPNELPVKWRVSASRFRSRRQRDSRIVDEVQRSAVVVAIQTSYRHQLSGGSLEAFSLCISVRLVHEKRPKNMNDRAEWRARREISDRRLDVTAFIFK